MLLRCESPWEATVLAFSNLQSFNIELIGLIMISMQNCSVCGELCDNDIRLLNHMMEKHGWRNPNVGKPDRNSRGY